MNILAHGENWEVAASHAITNVIEKYLADQGHNKQNLQENGTFELHYVPANAQKKSFTIPLNNPFDQESSPQLAANNNNKTQMLNIPNGGYQHEEDSTAHF